jgi:hypothetical protein
MTDKRRRNLIVLGSAALISLGMAGFAVEQRAAQGIPPYAPTTFLPDFSDKNAALIRIAGPAGTFDIVRTDKGWILPARNNYPANYDEVRHTLIGLASLQTIAPRTARADWLHYLALDAPPKGAGIQITVQDAKGATLATLIAGNTEDLGETNGASGLFVRRPGENQTWLARGVFLPHGDIGAWLSPHVFDVGPGRLKDVTLTPSAGPTVTIARSRPSVVFALADPPPPTKGVPDVPSVNNIAYAVSTFSFDDVRPAATMDFSKSSHAVAHSFDGLTVSFDLIRQGDDVWTRVSAAAALGANPDITQEAAAINAQAAGWAYKLPEQKGRALQSQKASLIKPPESAFPGVIPPSGATH